MDDELVERHVAVESVDAPVAIAPGLGQLANGGADAWLRRLRLSELMTAEGGCPTRESLLNLFFLPAFVAIGVAVQLGQRPIAPGLRG